MPVEWFEGWDLYTANVGVGSVPTPWQVDTGIGGGQFIRQTGFAIGPRNGRGFFVAGGNPAAGRIRRPVTNPTADIVIGTAVAFSVVSNTTSSNAGFGIVAATANLNITPNGFNKLQLLRGGVVVSTGITDVFANTYVYVIIYFNNITGAYSWYVNGVLQGSGTIASIGAIQYVRLANGNGDTYYDDVFAWPDPSGAELSAILAIGDMAVVYAMPDANGATQDWTPDSGTAYQRIDNQPFDNAQYIEAANVNDVSDFDSQDLSSGVFQVLGVIHNMYSRKTTAGAGSIQMSITAAGTPAAGAVHAQSESYSYYYDQFLTNPDTGMPWAPGDLATLGVSFERTA